VWLTRGDEEIDLLASAGTPSGGGSYARLEGHFREMAVSDHTIREIAAAKAPLVVRGVRGDEDWLTNAGWAARQGVRSFVALPLVGGDEAVGVLAVFDREIPDDSLIADLQLVAEVTAVRLTELQSRAAPAAVPAAPPTAAVVTRSELRAMEKANIEAALTRTSGKIFGADGAAALLGMRPTTLASRIKALEIR
jgi:transcriptional regulator with GAF, ATPase, and Fis domain